MELLLFTLCAATLTLLGAFLSGGMQPPKHTARHSTAHTTPEDDLEQDLAALLRYPENQEEGDGDEPQ